MFHNSSYESKYRCSRSIRLNNTYEFDLEPGTVSQISTRKIDSSLKNSDHVTGRYEHTGKPNIHNPNAYSQAQSPATYNPVAHKSSKEKIAKSVYVLYS